MSHSRSHDEESEDERYARMLQEEENRSMADQQARNQRFPQDMSHLSPQEREDMMFARQMANMDMQQRQYQQSQQSTHHAYGGRVDDDYDYPDDRYGHMRGAPAPSQRTADGGMNAMDSLDFDQFVPGQSAAYRGQHSGPPGQNSYGGGDTLEVQMEYARRLQEEAFRRMHGSGSSHTQQQVQSTEESDLELAMKMQMEEAQLEEVGDPNNNPLHHHANLDEDEDMKLARFMEESGVSIRDLDGEEVADLMRRNVNDLSGMSRGGGPPPRHIGGGGGMMSGLYARGRDDDDDDDEEDDYPPRGWTGMGGPPHGSGGGVMGGPYSRRGDSPPRGGGRLNDHYGSGPHNQSPVDGGDWHGSHSSNQSSSHQAVAPPPAQRPDSGMPTPPHSALSRVVPGLPSHAPSSANRSAGIADNPQGSGRMNVPYESRPHSHSPGHGTSSRNQSTPQRAALTSHAQRPAAGTPSAPNSAPSGIPAGLSSHAPPSPQGGIATGIPAPLCSTLASGIPASIPPASSASLGIPSGIPATNRSQIPSVIPDGIPAAIPPSEHARIPMNDSSASDRGGREFDRQVPPAKGFVRHTPTATKSGDVASPRRRLLGGTPPTRRTPGQTKSAGSLEAMQTVLARPRGTSPRRHRSGVSPLRRRDRSGSPCRDGGQQPSHERTKSLDFEDLPPGVDLPGANEPPGVALPGDLNAPIPAKKEKKTTLLKRIFGGKGNDERKNTPTDSFAAAIPAAIPDPDMDHGPLPYAVAANRNIAQNALRNSGTIPVPKATAVCSLCGGRSGKMIAAMDKRFHIECFRCMSCNELIDPLAVFAVSVDPMGEQQPLHRKCYAEFYGAPCAVCRKPIPANDDGSVSFIKHPFFTDEQMCPKHANDARRRCTGCHRFEPEDEHFADLNDGDRCACHACVRTVIMNNMDVKPLWFEVLRFFEFHLMLPIWQEMRDIPILVVGQDALNETQMKDGTSVHGDSSQIMTRGLCLAEHDTRMSFTVPSLRFNESSSCFEACGNSHSGFMNFEVDPMKGNTNAEVTAILCLSGLPRDLTASVLAHEATHAWIKLHPDYKATKPLPPQVEEGCAQLVAYLFLCDGLEPPRRNSGFGPSDERLRQYFKFSIETEDNDIYGEGYRKAAAAYATLGVGALLEHIVHFQEFPQF